MNTTHTLGPWQIGKHDGAICDENGCYIDVRNPANARIMAAAPELYTALADGVGGLKCCCKSSHGEKCWPCVARAALAKARDAHS